MTYETGKVRHFKYDLSRMRKEFPNSEKKEQKAGRWTYKGCILSVLQDRTGDAGILVETGTYKHGRRYSLTWNLFALKHAGGNADETAGRKEYGNKQTANPS